MWISNSFLLLNSILFNFHSSIFVMSKQFSIFNSSLLLLSCFHHSNSQFSKTTLLESPSSFLPIHLLFWYPSNCLFTLLLPLFLSSTDNCNFNDFWKVISVEHEISWLSSNDRSLEGTFLELVFYLFSSISFDLFRLQTQICPRKKKLRLLVLSF